MKKYLLRLDDACERMDIDKWNKIESLLDKHSIKPLVGIIPHCEDSAMDQYPVDDYFWDKVQSWIDKGWTIAMHGYNHVYSTKFGGINPVNKRSEFAGEPLIIQKEKIQKGVVLFRKHGINPQVFFAPSHTFDKNTLIALKEESDIRVISDTIANDAYRSGDFIFVPQQSGAVRKLPFKTVTFCYHPNSMDEKDFDRLEDFVTNNLKTFVTFDTFKTDNITKKYSLFDAILKFLYMIKH